MNNKSEVIFSIRRVRRSDQLNEVLRHDLGEPLGARAACIGDSPMSRSSKSVTAFRGSAELPGLRKTSW